MFGMRLWKRSVWPALVLAGIAIAAAGCGGGGGTGGQSSDLARPKATSEAILDNAPEALGASAQAFKNQVQSLRGEFTLDMSSAGVSISARGDILFEAPDKMDMTMSMSGGGSGVDLSQLGNFEYLLLGDKMYMKLGAAGWAGGSFSDLGVDGNTIKSMQSNHSLIDYNSLVKEAGGKVQYLGKEDVDGTAAAHYRMTMDIGQALKSMSSALGSGESVLGGSEQALDSLSGPAVMDVWVDPGTMLPQRFNADFQFNIAGQQASLKMSMLFYGYNEPVNMPKAPADTKPFDKMFKGLLGGAGH